MKNRTSFPPIFHKIKKLLNFKYFLKIRIFTYLWLKVCIIGQLQVSLWVNFAIFPPTQRLWQTPLPLVYRYGRV